MKLKNISEANLKGKTVLYRAPYDIEVEEKDGVLRLADDMRIKATVPTLQFLLKNECKVVILTYVGRPDGKVVENLRTGPHAKRLSELLNHPVAKVDDCVGPVVEERIANMQPGDILMLENVRFHAEEMRDDEEFAKKLCAGKDLVVFDGFPQAHRKHSSTTGIERHLPSVAGLYLEQEVNMLSGLLQNPRRPFTVIIGGAKISDKVGAVKNLLKVADTLMVGGALANIFLKAEGKRMGSSFVEDVFVDQAKREKKDPVEIAKEIFKETESLGKKFVTPRDLTITDGKSISISDMKREEVPDGWMAMDIGPRAEKDFSLIIDQSQTVFLAGPLGKFEDERFARGSKVILKTMKNADCDTILAGGDTIDCARRYGGLEGFSHVSLAGGATLEFLAGNELPALLPLIKERK